MLISVAWILFRRRPLDPLAALFGISFLLWTISSSGDFASSDQFEWRLLVDRLRFLPFALGLSLFPDGQWQARTTRPLAVAIVIVFAIGVTEALGLSSTRIYLPLAIGCVLAALVALLARYRALPEIGQLQLKWITFGLIAGIGLILTARAGASLRPPGSMPTPGTVLLEGLFQLGIVVIALGFLTSLIRYRLYDAEAAISRSAVYAALTLTLVGTFAASEALIELVGQRLFGMAIGNVSGAVAAAIAAMMLTPLHGKINGWAERHFQHDLAALKQDLPDLLIALSGGSLKDMASAVLPHIERAVQATRLALMFDGRLVAAHGISRSSALLLLGGWQPAAGGEPIVRDDHAPFPFAMALRCPLGSPRAWLLLGPRPDGSYYGKDDLEALEEIAAPLQRSLFVVAAREEWERRQRNRHNSLVQRVEMLTARLDRLERHRVDRGTS